MRKVFVADPQDVLTHWLCRRLNYVPTKDMVCFGQYDADEERIIAVVGFDSWSETAVEMHVASDSPNWMNRELLWKSFYYPFVTGGKSVVLARVAADNKEAMRLDLKLGFLEMCRIPNAAPGEVDLVVLAMQREGCRWLNLAPPAMREAA